MSAPRRTPLSSITVTLSPTAALIRNDDAIDPDFRGTNCIGRVQDALDDQRARKQAPIAFEITPSLSRGRGLPAAECNDIGGARAIAGVRRPVPQGRCVAEAYILDDPGGMGDCLQ